MGYLGDCRLEAWGVPKAEAGSKILLYNAHSCFKAKKQGNLLYTGSLGLEPGSLALQMLLHNYNALPCMS